jgi:hypothetical protein
MFTDTNALEKSLCPMPGECLLCQIESEEEWHLLFECDTKNTFKKATVFLMLEN